MQSPLIIGASSTIGSALYRRLKTAGIHVAGTARNASGEFVALDLAQDPDTWPVLPHSDVAFFCAAQTKLDACKADPQASRLINVVHMQELARRLQAQGTFIIFLSSNQVFNGEKPYRKADEPTDATNDYGRQKAEFEQWLLSSGHPAAVLRLTKVISSRLPLLDKWQTSLREGKTVEAFSDLVFAPLPLEAVLNALEFLGNEKKSGVYQLSGTHDVSYFAIAQEVAKRMGADSSLVKETSALAAGIAPEFLPRYGTLDRATLPTIAVPEPMRVVFAD